MKIPREVKALIRRRKKLAEDLCCVSSQLDEWMESQGMNLIEHGDYTNTGCMIYCEPDDTERCVIRAIEEFKPVN